MTKPSTIQVDVTSPAELLLSIVRNSMAEGPDSSDIAAAGCFFLEHLSGVQDVLQSWNEPEYVCNAGLFHSVYGTELFQVCLLLPKLPIHQTSP